MLRQGPISHFLHGAIEYVAAILLIAAPFLFSFDSNAATALAVVTGVIVLILAASSDSPTSLINSVPIATHVVLDYVLAGVLIASPFLFGFTDETTATSFFLLLGIVHLLVTIGTRFKPADAPADAR
jgi:hypothetical protein